MKAVVGLNKLEFDETEQEVEALLSRLTPAEEEQESEGWESYSEQRSLLESVVPAL